MLARARPGAPLLALARSESVLLRPRPTSFDARTSPTARSRATYAFIRLWLAVCATPAAQTVRRFAVGFQQAATRFKRALGDYRPVAVRRLRLRPGQRGLSVRAARAHQVFNVVEIRSSSLGCTATRTQARVPLCPYPTRGAVAEARRLEDLANATVSPSAAPGHRLGSSVKPISTRHMRPMTRRMSLPMQARRTGRAQSLASFVKYAVQSFA